MTPAGIGVVGCGVAAVDICRAIDALPGARLAAAHDRVEALAVDLAAPRGAAVYASLEGLLADPVVEVVYVGLPHDLLAPVAARAIATGHHVYVEKPAGLDAASIERLGALAAARGVILGVVFEFRAAAAVREARRLVAGGAIGEVRGVRIRTIIDKPATYWRTGPCDRIADDWRSRKARAGGGVVLMNAIHQLDIVRFVTGLPVVRVVADVATLAAPAGVEVEDTGAAVLRLGNGALASLTATAHSPGAEREERIEIDGALGRLDLPDPYGPGALRLFLRQPWDDLPAGTWLERAADGIDEHVASLAALLDAVRTGSTPLATGVDAAAALATVTAIYESAAAGRAVDVTFEEDQHDA